MADMIALVIGSPLGLRSIIVSLSLPGHGNDSIEETFIKRSVLHELSIYLIRSKHEKFNNYRGEETS